LRTTGVRAAVERSVDIKTVRGIEIAEHPWKKMMGVNKPAAEPLAELVPHDNYYLRFKTFAKFNEFSVLMDKWGTPASRAYESQSRDHALKERYERQLCLKSTYLGRTLGPLLIKSIAITGSDPYIREGTDVTVLFHVNNRSLFLTGVEQFIDEARKEHGARLKESKQVYNSIPIESFVTPLREVSVHRAGFGDFVVYSNSPVGLRRVIDTHQRKHKSLASSLDFQYMRTVFRADDKEEDGFAFLSDAFIRQLVGPASKIKEMRRLEAMTSMSMVNNAALFAAWETGKLPGDHDALLKAAHLKQEHLFVPEGKPIRWDATQKTAVSDVYNTLHFTTPLIETPIDKITWYEDQTYREFRVGYEQLWRQFFDPVGIRFNLGKEQIKLEVYVLPMVNNAEYNKLRQWTGRDVMQFDPSKLSPRSLLQFTTSIGGDFKWGLIRLDDNKTLARLGEWWIRNDLLSKERTEYDTEAARLILQLPITAGIGDRGNWIRGLVIATLKDTDRFGPAKFTDSTYNATVITKMTLGPDSKIVKNLNEKLEKGKLQQVVVYYATIDDGWYIGFDKQALKDLIDRAEQRKKNPPKADTVDTNASWHVSPAAAIQAGEALRQYLEWETHKRALPNDALWYILYRAKLIDAKTPEPAKRDAALKYLGFIPVSPDDVPYRYDAARDEMVNQRHGSLRQPTLHPSIADTSPLVELLARFPSLRVDLRFREDGFHSTLTLQRKTMK
ncbi:MAG: hypothetical protein HY289_03110, partial [Planctomycetes bacterium]|nr:hypothetical protein [Planctomycetota bacterium]